MNTKYYIFHIGNALIEGYHNFDRRSQFAEYRHPNFTYSEDNYYLKDVEINSVEIIRAMPGTIEEISLNEIDYLLSRWYDLLQSGGQLILESFDIRILCSSFLYGNINLVSFREAMNKFKSVHTNTSLIELCAKFGFEFNSMYYDNEIVKITFRKP